MADQERSRTSGCEFGLDRPLVEYADTTVVFRNDDETESSGKLVSLTQTGRYGYSVIFKIEEDLTGKMTELTRPVGPLFGICVSSRPVCGTFVYEDLKLIVVPKAQRPSIQDAIIERRAVPVC